ncbi:MAG: calcium/sodium antiporter [Pseudomonadota bacterium]
MTDLIAFASLVGGLLLLGGAGDFLVGGAVSLGRHLGVSPLVAGIFVVGFGTSAPEMLVAVDAALEGYPELALGNIVGSNIANVWLVLGLPALIAPLAAGGFGQTRALIAMMIATVSWIFLTALGPLHAGIGAAFILGLVVYALITFYAVRSAVAAGVDVGMDDDLDIFGWPKTLVYLAIGLIGLPIGAHLIVDGGVHVARTFDVPEEIIGLTLLAVGTSLPEIGAGIAAALKGHGSVCVGNVLGSNIFNIAGAGGIVGLMAGFAEEPVSITATFMNYDHWAMMAAALTLAGFILLRTQISRLAGVLLLLVYGLYLYGLVSGWNIRALLPGIT